MSMLESQGATVLVADCEERVLQQVSTTLAKAGFTVVTVRSQAAALAFCRDVKEPVQLAIVDASMGADNPGWMQELQRTCPRVLITGDADEPEAPRCLSPLGRFHGFLTKPFRRAQLLGCVLQAMDTPLARSA